MFLEFHCFYCLCSHHEPHLSLIIIIAINHLANADAEPLILLFHLSIGVVTCPKIKVSKYTLYKTYTNMLTFIFSLDTQICSWLLGSGPIYFKLFFAYHDLLPVFVLS